MSTDKNGVNKRIVINKGKDLYVFVFHKYVLGVERNEWIKFKNNIREEGSIYVDGNGNAKREQFERFCV